MSALTRIEEISINIDDRRIELVENEKSFTGYSWKPLSTADHSLEPGVPASVFEVAMWKKMMKLIKLVEILTAKIKEYEKDVSKDERKDHYEKNNS